MVVVDESSVTGESNPISKQAPSSFNEEESKSINCFLISGSKVTEGSGDMLVSAVGVNS